MNLEQTSWIEPRKEAVVAELGQIFADSGVVVVAHYEGLSVAEMTDFRLRMKQAGGGVRVAKNRLAKIALKGTPGEKMGDLLKGMTVLAYSEDPVAAAKVVDQFVKDNKKMFVLGGAMGATPLDEAGVKAVAAMPSREELIASVVACIGAPAAQLVECHWRAGREYRGHSRPRSRSVRRLDAAIWRPELANP